MARRRIGQEALRLTAGTGSRRSSLEGLARLIDWTPIENELIDIHAAVKGEPGWPPLAMFKAMLIAVWYDLSDVKLAEALDDRASFRRFCGFSADEPTPERTAFVRFRKQLLARGLDARLFCEITKQFKRRTATVKTGTLVDATVIASASHQDGEAAWAGHRGRKAVHSFKAHVAADADTALVEELLVTPGNVHEGQVGGHVLPDVSGHVYADSGYRGSLFAAAVLAKQGIPRVVQTSIWGRPGDDTLRKLRSWNHGIQRVRCRIEKIFGAWKRCYGLRRMRWRGLAKAALQVRITAIAYNFRRTATLLQAATA
ncbi:IS5 family transposase (plasmid) [Lichenicola cladoniae]|uniref:IS5 family transposase n=1 Tax=Lichenicola cladoniae TaxID=1484109 RepID=A0A6M8HYY1_9PROT|nr:IS5 family transposase [Lichenicola cladoniae]NPD69588.1 IS5 family transposase [Acetobacteraceae bacterium]QKE93466.1 IS5 family transposase [Lichenicola cladoniae]